MYVVVVADHDYRLGYSHRLSHHRRGGDFSSERSLFGGNVVNLGRDEGTGLVAEGAEHIKLRSLIPSLQSQVPVVVVVVVMLLSLRRRQE